MPALDNTWAPCVVSEDLPDKLQAAAGDVSSTAAAYTANTAACAARLNIASGLASQGQSRGKHSQITDHSRSIRWTVAKQCTVQCRNLRAASPDTLTVNVRLCPDCFSAAFAQDCSKNVAKTEEGQVQASALALSIIPRQRCCEIDQGDHKCVVLGILVARLSVA